MPLFERQHRRRCVVVDHHHRHRLVGRVGVVGVELHQGGHVGQAQVVAARGDAGHGAARTVAQIHRHIEPGGLEVPFGHRLQKQRRRALKAPSRAET